MKTFRKAIAAASTICALALTIGGATPSARASVAQPAVVSTNPADTTPHVVLDSTSDSIYAFAQVGKTMFAGGRFDQVQNPTRTATYSRQNFFAFDSETGALSPLTLNFDGIVSAVVSAPDGTAVYIGGAFKTVNGVAHRALVKYDLVNHRLDPTFRPTVTAATVGDVILANGHLIVGGSFPSHLVGLDPKTGVDTGYIRLTIAGVTNPRDVTRVRHIAVSPDGSRLVATGNFATVNGQSRKQAFELSMGFLTGLNSWHSPRFDDFTWASLPHQRPCASTTTLVTAQDVDFSPDGSYFVITAVGGPSGTTRGLCDAAGRFETANVSGTAEPTWINWSGGDSIFSVSVTGSAVYVGGHQRWLDNPLGRDTAGPGSVSRPGVGVLDPATGKALPWVDPTHSRHHGTVELFATPCGMWFGSDGETFSGEYHGGIGFAPLPQPPGEPRVVPFSCPDTFVAQQFSDFSGRQPTTAEAAPYANAINSGAKSADQVINEISRIDAARTEAPIIRLYRSYFRRLPDKGGLDYHTGQYARHVKTAGTISGVFAGSNEFIHTYGSLSNTQFVQLVYNNVLGRPADSHGTAYWVNKLNDGYRRSDMMLFFSESNENKTNTQNAVDAVVIYRGMLQRIPSSTELAAAESAIGGGGLNNLIHAIRIGAEYANRL